MQLSQILSYRNEDMLVKSSDAMRQIALAAKAENELMSTLIGESRKDSRTVKILTYTALIYLPASLVAVSFVTLAHVFFLFSLSNVPFTKLAD